MIELGVETRLDSTSPTQQAERMVEWLPDFVNGATNHVGYLSDLTVQRIEGLFGKEANMNAVMVKLRGVLPDFYDNPEDSEVFGLFLCGYPIEAIQALYGEIEESMERIHEKIAIVAAAYQHEISQSEQLSPRRIGNQALLSEEYLVEVDSDLIDTNGSDVWQDRALCAQTDPEAFFPEKGGSTREAKKICLDCEVRIECLEYALDHDERFGIWGGLSERERRRLKKGII